MLRQFQGWLLSSKCGTILALNAGLAFSMFTVTSKNATHATHQRLLMVREWLTVRSLWHILNDTATSARAMSWSHRQEHLDIHMGDSNWKKLTRIGIVQHSSNCFFIFYFFRSSYIIVKVASLPGSVWRCGRISYGTLVPCWRDQDPSVVEWTAANAEGQGSWYHCDGSARCQGKKRLWDLLLHRVQR